VQDLQEFREPLPRLPGQVGRQQRTHLIGADRRLDERAIRGGHFFPGFRCRELEHGPEWRGTGGLDVGVLPFECERSLPQRERAGVAVFNLRDNGLGQQMGAVAEWRRSRRRHGDRSAVDGAVQSERDIDRAAGGELGLYVSDDLQDLDHAPGGDRRQGAAQKVQVVELAGIARRDRLVTERRGIELMLTSVWRDDTRADLRLLLAVWLPDRADLAVVLDGLRGVDAIDLVARKREAVLFVKFIAKNFALEGDRKLVAARGRVGQREKAGGIQGKGLHLRCSRGRGHDQGNAAGSRNQNGDANVKARHLQCTPASVAKG
jgi:hypothetical protein